MAEKDSKNGQSKSDFGPSPPSDSCDDRNPEGEFEIDEVIRPEDFGRFRNELLVVAGGLLKSEFKVRIGPDTLVHTALRRNRRKDQPWSEVTWKNQRYFFGAMKRAMDRALKDKADEANAQKRPHLVCLPDDEVALLMDASVAMTREPEVIAALRDALEDLKALDGKCYRIITYKFWFGWTYDEIAKILDVSERHVRREWEKARKYFIDKLGGKSE